MRKYTFVTSFIDAGTSQNIMFPLCCTYVSYLILYMNSFITDLQQIFYEIIPFKLGLGSFYKEFPCNFFFYREIPLLFFPTLKFEIEFHSHKKVVSPKLENCAHLFFLSNNCAKFQETQRTFFSHSSFRPWDGEV